MGFAPFRGFHASPPGNSAHRQPTPLPRRAFFIHHARSHNATRCPATFRRPRRRLRHRRLLGLAARRVTALGAHDIATAQKEVNRAATAWPTQEAYAWGRAVIAATAHDTSALLAALCIRRPRSYRQHLRAHPLIGPFTTLPAFSSVATRVLANGAPLVRSRVRATVADTTLWPEGVDFDPRTKRFYIASVRHRTIVEISPDGSTRELFARDQPNIGAILGLRIDSARGVLWATTTGLPQMEGYHPADSTIAALLRIRISDGYIEGRWDIPPVTGGHTIGDLALGPQGDVFLTDSNQPVLYRLRPSGDTLEHMTHPLFHSPQGLAPTPMEKRSTSPTIRTACSASPFAPTPSPALPTPQLHHSAATASFP